jgi:hypothetical protein
VVEDPPVRGEGATVEVTIPALADEASAAVAPSAPVAPAPAPQHMPTPPVDQDSGGDRSTRLPWAAIVGGVGIVATGVGAGFGASASSQWKVADAACPGGHCKTATDRQKGIDAGSTADISTVLFLVGGAAIASGVVLWLTAPTAQCGRR